MTARGHHREIGPGDHLYLVDGSGFIFRAYHALPPLSRKSDGLPTGAVAGFSNMLWKLLQDMKAGDRPTHLAVIFDAGRSSFRNAIYGEYKANRTDPPDDLVPQFPLTREATRAFGVPCVEKQGFEADDLIATYARLAREAGAKVTIASSDKDLMQLVRDGEIEMFDPMKGKRFGSAEVIERFGVPPEKVIYVQALAGDSIDNVPGVPGIGVKTAAELIGIYGDLETLLARAGEIKQPKRRETLLANVENARVSERLVKLDDAVPIDEQISEFGVREPDPKELIPFLKAMEFSALLKRAAVKLGVDDVEIVTGEEIAQIRTVPPERVAPPALPAAEVGCPGAVRDRAEVLRPIDYGRYKTITDVAALQRVVAMAHETGAVALSIQTEIPDPMQARIIGIALAPAPGVACYIPLPRGSDGGLDLSGPTPGMLTEVQAMTVLGPLLEDDAILKIGHDLKFAAVVLLQRGIRLKPGDDPMLMSYVLDAGVNGHGFAELSELHLKHKPIALADLIGKGRDRVTLDKVPLPEATRYAAEQADIALRLDLC